MTHRVAMDRELAEIRAAKVAGRAPSPSPCDGCRRSAVCGPEQLACAAFELHATTGRFSQYAPRQASRERWLRLFGEVG